MRKSQLWDIKSQLQEIIANMKYKVKRIKKGFESKLWVTVVVKTKQKVSVGVKSKQIVR